MRKIRFILVILLTILSINLYAQDDKLYCFYDNEVGEIEAYAGGYKDASGKIIIPKGKYIFVWTPVFDKIAFVTTIDKRYCAIDRTENILFDVVPPNELGEPYIINNTFCIEQNGKKGVADMKGNIIIQPSYDAISPLLDMGLILFCVGGHQAKDGDMLFWEGGKWGAMDKNGKIIIPAEYDEARSGFLKKKGKWYKITDDWKLVLKD